MIAISPVRTRRLNVELSELSAGDVIYLCSLPDKQHEYGASELLRRIVKPCDKPRVGQVTDTRLWSVQERSFVIAHYTAHITDGEPDFRIGDQGAKFSDYLIDGADAPPDEIKLGVIAEDEWLMRPLLGAHAESIERLVMSERLPAARHGWWVGAMAVQLHRSNEKPFDVTNCMDAQLDDFIAERAEILLTFPESDFMDLLQAFLSGTDKMQHLFKLEFIDSGVVWSPVKEVPGSTLARFPVSSAVSERSTQAFGRPD